MNHKQSEKSIKCNLFIDHQLSWAGDGYFCENCRVRFEPVRDERSEESANIPEVRCEYPHTHLKTCAISDDQREESVVIRERTRIIKALEGLRREYDTKDDDVSYEINGFNQALDQAIKAVGESAANSARKEKDEK